MHSETDGQMEHSDAYVSDADGNRVESGEYVKIDIEWETRPRQAAQAALTDTTFPLLAQHGIQQADTLPLQA